MLTRLIWALLVPFALLFLGSPRFEVLDLRDLQFELTWDDITEDLCG